MWYWLSFATPKEFRGVCVVWSTYDYLDAIKESIAQKCNPGPECSVKGFPLREGTMIDPAFVNRLLTLEEAKYLDEALAAGAAPI